MAPDIVRVEVQVYGSGMAANVLNAAVWLVPLVGIRRAAWLATLAAHWLLWARIGGRWERVGKDMTVNMWESWR